MLVSELREDSILFIRMSCREPAMALMVNAATIARVHPNIRDDGEFDGSVVTMIDGEVFIVDESTTMISAAVEG